MKEVVGSSLFNTVLAFLLLKERLLQMVNNKLQREKEVQVNLHQMPSTVFIQSEANSPSTHITISSNLVLITPFIVFEKRFITASSTSF